MTGRAWAVLMAWCMLLIGGATWVQGNLEISADLRLFMPTPRDDAQRLVLDNIGESPASRLELLAIAGADTGSLVRISNQLAVQLAASPEFDFVSNGAQAALEIPERLLPYRYLMSDSFDGQPLDATQLTLALAERAADMNSPAAMFLEEWLARDPTLETMKLGAAWAPAREPQRIDDVWFSADGKQALLIAQTRAAAFDPDGQSAALERLRAEFENARGLSPATLTISGTGYFSSVIRNRTQREAAWFGAAATVGLSILILCAYRRPRFVLLGALPLLSGGLAGLVAVGSLFDSVHGITLAFGFTLLGVAQDYPVHLFSHLRPGESATTTARGVWRPLMTGVVSTCIAYLAFLATGVVGLAQLACLTITGLAVAALTTRYSLPQIIGTVHRDVADTTLLSRLDAQVERLPRPLWMLVVILLACGAILFWRQEGFWQNDLSRLTPVPPELLATDAALRREMATPDLRYLLVVSGDSEQSVLERLETLRATLTTARHDGSFDSFDDPSRYLPSADLQRRRQLALPDPDTLRSAIASGAADLPFTDGLFEPFLVDLASASKLPPLTLADLSGTPLDLRVGSSLFERSGRWHGLVSLYGVNDPAALARAFAGVSGVSFLDLKSASETLVTAQRSRMILSLSIAALLLVAVVSLALRRLRRVLRVVTPMVLTTLLIVAILRGADVSLSHFHLISLVLAAGLGLDYALFFEHTSKEPGARKRTLHGLLVCSASTLLVFALLALSSVPVLRAIGVTVTLGVIGNFLLAALLSRERVHS